MMSRFVVLFALFVMAACGSQKALSPQVDWVAHSPQWKQQARDVFAQAGNHAEKSAAIYPPQQWVVVLDLDETVLNNVQYQMNLQRSGDSFSLQSWKEWTDQQRASLVPGAYDYIKQVRALGGLVALVTNRRDIEQLATEQNLAALGLRRGEDFQLLMTRATPYGESSKESRFSLVPIVLKSMGYVLPKVVAYIGDAAGDRPKQLKDAAFFCINQGAMYGEPCMQTP